MFWLSHRPNRKRARRRAENQRLSRKRREPDKPLHILDAQTYSSRELQIKRAAQLRAILLCSALVLSIAALISTGRILLNKFLFESPELTVTNLEVRADGILSTNQILQFARVRKGAGILGLNLGEIRENLLQHPQIRDVKIDREFPGTVRIAVEERFAIAWLRSKEPRIDPSRGGGVLLDDNGIPFICESLMQEYYGLPVISVPRLHELVPGKKIEHNQVRVALELLHTSRQGLYDLNLEILAIHAPNPYSIVAKYNNESKVTFGLSDLTRQVSNLRAALMHAQSINKSIASINLLMSRNIPVTYRDSAAPADVAREPMFGYVPRAAPASISRPSTAPPVLVAPEAVREVGATGIGRDRSDSRDNQIRSILGN